MEVRLYKNKIGKTFRTHQLIAMAFLNHVPNGHKLVVDHIDNDKLNNKANNLQLVSQRKNASKDQFRLNRSSQYVGVNLCKRAKIKNRWVARITINGKMKRLGGFNTELEANEAYCKALKELS